MFTAKDLASVKVGSMSPVPATPPLEAQVAAVINRPNDTDTYHSPL